MTTAEPTSTFTRLVLAGVDRIEEQGMEFDKMLGNNSIFAMFFALVLGCAEQDRTATQPEHPDPGDTREAQ